MQGPEGKFVGGIDTVTPKKIAKQEEAAYQRTEILGLNADFLNQSQSVQLYVGTYKNKKLPLSVRREYLGKLITVVSGFKTYEERIAEKNAITPESGPAVFGKEARPYIQAIDELTEDIQEIARGIDLSKFDRDMEERGASPDVDLATSLLEERAILILKILRSKLTQTTAWYAQKNALATGSYSAPVRYENPEAEAEALEKIEKRLGYARSLIQKGPLKGSFSYIMKDGRVLPIDWEPTEEDKRKLRGTTPEER